MKLCVVGTGYVGLVSGACLADVGNDVWCVDKDASKIERLKKFDIPIHEPGLRSIVERNVREKRLFFTSRLEDGLSTAELCFITVDTPLGADGRADVGNVMEVGQCLGELLQAPIMVITKSTVPVGTTLKLKETIEAGLKKRGLNLKQLVKVANNPEFLKEGDAVADFMKPDRVVVGTDDDDVALQLRRLYRPFMRKMDRFLVMDIASSELCKYAANAMLATRISFMNELARLCERVGADIDALREGLGSDPRIGPPFLFAGLGYGGSCFPKDMKALIELGREQVSPLSIVESADRANDMQREWFWEKIRSRFGKGTNFAGKKIAVWGIAFKPETDDVRSAPSLYLIERLLEAKAHVSAYDPAASENGKKSLGEKAEKVQWCASSYECLKNADALIICTEWREFRSPDFKKMKLLMQQPLLFDGRRLYEPDDLKRHGFEYVTVGS